MSDSTKRRDNGDVAAMNANLSSQRGVEADMKRLPHREYFSDLLPWLDRYTYPNT